MREPTALRLAPRRSSAVLLALSEIVLLLAIVLGFTTVILLMAGAPPLKAYYHIIMGSLGSWGKLGHVIKAWIPLTLCACGLLYTFRIGLWNIGVEGQNHNIALCVSHIAIFYVILDRCLKVV